ncbi:MAG: glycosyltransferase, group 1 family [Fibrobacteres bacterium]|nr:glycosyltransferase, group 1 family [Fibrobacterota bacterium]
MALTGIIRFVALYSLEFALNLPALFRLRSWYRRVKSVHAEEPMVACVGENLDEVNGIALTSRIMLRELRNLGKQVFIFGTAFHEKQPRSEGPDGSVVMAPGRYSMDQAGYAASEVAMLRLDSFIHFLRMHPVDVIEFQTPGPVSVQCLVAARFAGIKTLSHYRTDIITYSKLLVKNRLGVWIINTWTTLMTRWMGPVVVPSEAYRKKVQEMGVPIGRIYKLPRGVDFKNFHPEKAANGAWRAFGLPEEGIRLMYVGRVSREKNLDALADAFPSVAARTPGVSLTVVGAGPYLEGLKERFAGRKDVFFTGVVHGESLSGLFASADILVFPSLTDTFGNSVVEALASGIPCITSDEGGPREIIVDGECGLVFDHALPGDLEAKILALAGDPAKLLAFKAKARERAMQFTYDRSAHAFWDFYTRYHNNRL